jgi:signal peptidase I
MASSAEPRADDAMSDFFDSDGNHARRGEAPPSGEPDSPGAGEQEGTGGNEAPQEHAPLGPPSPWRREPEGEPDPERSVREREPEHAPWQQEPSTWDRPGPGNPQWSSDPASTRPSPWDEEPNEPPPWLHAPPPTAAPPPEPPPKGFNPLVRLGIPQPWRTIIDWIVTIAGAVLIVLAIKAWVVNPYRIPSSSMEPTLHCARPGAGCTARFSDRVLACRFCYHFESPKRGDIVVFNVPSEAEQACGAGGVFVKRIIGLPGETWQEKDGYVYIDGKKLDEPYIKPERRDFQSYPAQKIKPDNYFMMGDNRQSSCDSRRWGTVPRKSIIGKVFAIYWPPQRIRWIS